MPDNIMDSISPDGVFAESFKGQAIAIAGDDFKDSKVFDDVPDVSTLIKNYANTKASVGKKLDGVLTLPTDKSTDDERAEFRTSALKAIGAPDKADDYEFPRPEGLQYNEDNEKIFRDLFHENNVPVGMAKVIVEKNNEMQVAAVKAHLEGEQQQFDTDAKAYTDARPGDSLIAGARTAHNAIMEFGGDIKIDGKALTEILKEAKIYDNAGDLKKWNDAGVQPTQLALWQKIGEKMKSPEPPGNEESGPEEGKSKALVGPQGIYNHPTSAVLAVKDK